jgi:glycosyltransferase involved in cell wall biosynthesis
MPDMKRVEMSNLTIWIPTYNRPRELARLVRQAQGLGLTSSFKVIISDNGSEELYALEDSEDTWCQIAWQDRGCNLSAGANFLRAFEEASTEWVHIMSDDDTFSSSYIDIVKDCIQKCGDSIVAIKFDTSLFGKQVNNKHSDLTSAIADVTPSEIGSWFNNLLLISGWIFRRKEYLRYISKAYLGYSTKLSHILPALACCEAENKQILFSDTQPVIFNHANDDGWPRAPSWVEMCLATQLGYGYLSACNRRTLNQCLFRGKTDRLVAKILRIRAFYNKPQCDIHWTKILLTLCIISLPFCMLVVVMLPFLWVPTRLWPRQIVQRLGGVGSAERW